MSSYRKLFPWISLGHKPVKILVISIGILLYLFYWAQVIKGPRGDFPGHYLIGKRFAAGEFLYPGGFRIPYPPFWAMVHAPLTAIPVQVVQPIVFPLSILSLWGLLIVLCRLTEKRLPLIKEKNFWVIALTIFFSSRYIFRDLPECGVNLFLVFLSWVAIYLWRNRSELQGGMCLGLAIALKCTPVLFLLYFILKREWKMVVSTLVSVILLSLMPVAWNGYDWYSQHMKVWTGTIVRGITHPDPSIGVLGEEKVQNMSLRPALARFLIHLNPGHRARIDHPWYREFLNLSPVAAGWIIRVGMIAFLLWIAWAFRRRIAKRDAMTVYWECGAVSVLILLYSPITWEHHCVGVIPAIYLLVLTALKGQKLPRWAIGIMIGYTVFVILLNRFFLGKELSLLLHSYHVQTWSILGLLIIVLWRWKHSKIEFQNIEAYS